MSTAAGNGLVRVLVVDDEPDVRFVLRQVLSAVGGFEVVAEAVDGNEAIEKAGRLQPDVVLLDLLMPGLPGDEALPHLLRVAPSTMVVVFSGSGLDEHQRRELMSAGAFAYYDKADVLILAQRLTSDLQRFQRVLDGEDTVPGWMTDGHSGH